MQNPSDLIETFNALTSDHKEVLEKYRMASEWEGGSQFAYDINRILSVHGMPTSGPAVKSIIDLDAAIASAGVLTHPLTVYRVIGNVSDIGSLTPGNIWTAPTFLSTSLFWNNLHTHLTPPPDLASSEAAMLTIRLPKGTTLAYLGGADHASAEAEILLGRDHEFKVIAESKGDIRLYANPVRVKHFSGLREVTLELIR